MTPENTSKYVLFPNLSIANPIKGAIKVATKNGVDWREPTKSFGTAYLFVSKVYKFEKKGIRQLKNRTVVATKLQ